MAVKVSPGFEAYKSGDFAAAETAYSEALASAEDAEARTAALASRAQSRLRLRRFAEAREDASLARTLMPSNAKAWYRLGTCEAILGNFADAETAFEEAIQLAPEDRGVREALAAARRSKLESSGRYCWEQVYERYLTPWAPSADETPLGVEAFVGPVRLGHSPGRGRGIFVTEDVPAGRLLLVAAAVARGRLDVVEEAMLKSTRHSAELAEAVSCLSRGPGESESALPSLSPSELAAPGRFEYDREVSDGVPLAELREILRHNQFSLPMMNPNTAPIEIGNDPERSGLWLLPSFLNHSCRPNTQRVIVRDMFFLRASRDLEQGEELFESYTQALQPLDQRRADLQQYGIDPSTDERCLLEVAVLDESKVNEIISLAFAGAECQGGAMVEEAAAHVEALVAQALAQALVEGKVPSSRSLPTPETAVPIERMAMLREGFEMPADAAEERSFQRQLRLQRSLTGSFVNVLRSHAARLNKEGDRLTAAAVFTAVLDILDEVLPCSELAAIVSSEMLSSKLIAFQLEFKDRCRPSFHRALRTTHLAYGGGAAVWRQFNAKMFAESVREGASSEWARLKPVPFDGGFSSSDVSVPERAASAPRRSSEGFDDLLRRRAKAQLLASECQSPVGMDTAERPTQCDKRPTDELSAPPALQVPEEAPATAPGSLSEPVVVATLPGLSSGAEASLEVSEREVPEASAIVSSSGSEVVVVASLPGLSSGSEASLEVSEREVLIRSLRPDCAHSLKVALPEPVDPASSVAKWSRRTSRLTVRLARGA